jgi:hypothetical protein
MSKGGRQRRWWATSLQTKIALAMTAVALLVVGAVLGTSFQLRRQELLGEFQLFVRSVAGTTALALSSSAPGRSIG